MTQPPQKPALTPHGEEPASRLSRRQALLRLGLASAIAYSVPTLMHLDRAEAYISPSRCAWKNKKNCGGQGGH